MDTKSMSDERQSRGTKDPAGTPLLLVGLGNPGSQYAKNRHNAGFIVVDEIHAAHGFGPWKTKFDGLISEGRLAGRKTYLLKPQTYMNLSGDSVGPALRFFKLPLSALVVIHDEIDLAAGKLKVKTGGGDAGQNGLKSITATIGPDYRRVRVGIGHPGQKEMVSGHVLANFSKDEIVWLKPMVEAMVQAAPLLAKDDDNGFMSKVALLTQPPKPKKDVE
ncbi:MAG: aminoacyl-tRNA hydrolase [Alphaproteobacteria bacterium 64-11]|nr:aminoacyl-tRNA hydrolase [Alphaproteobacteria bacterium]OJU13997.1 MAG: aminoacyl-tRNA hydrolase [Alphaproteobacteria bacterium 64-11]